MPSNLYYTKKQAGFYERTEGEITPLFIYQPTPLGVMALCQHYAEKYAIDLSCVDLRDEVLAGDNALDLFRALEAMPSRLALNDGMPKGLILSHGEHHAIPVLLCQKDEQQHMIILDSSSGARIKGFFNIAALFPQHHVHLNHGTRQSDGSSCITDAICILKEALQVDNLIDLVEANDIPEHPAFRPGRFFSIPKPDNFHVFTMPEKLLLTAQVSAYLEAADQDTIIRGGQSLRYYREQFAMHVTLLKNNEEISTQINGYLYVKSLEHRNILDYRLSSEAKRDAEELLRDDPEVVQAGRYLADESKDESQGREPRPPTRFSLSPSKVSFNSIMAPSNARTDNARYLSVSR